MQQRPVFLNLLAIKFPLTAIASIAHRISGVLLFLSIPLLLMAFDYSVSSQYYFYKLKDIVSGFVGKSITLVIVLFFLYHILAGIRHLIMDAGYFESKQHARLASIILFAVFGLGALLVFILV